MTDVPHLFVRTRVTSGGGSAAGLTAEGLPPKWFTKNPATTFEQDLPDMLEVIGHAADLAEQIAQRPISFFDALAGTGPAPERVAYIARAWPRCWPVSGVALVERAVLDGLCRLAAQPLHRMVAENRLGLRLGRDLCRARRVRTVGSVTSRPTHILFRSAHNRPCGRAVARGAVARRPRGRWIATGSGGFDSRLRSTVLQSEVERPSRARPSAPSGSGPSARS